MADQMRDGDLMEGQVVELTEAEQAQHQLQMEQQLKAFWAKQLVEVRAFVCEFVLMQLNTYGTTST